MDFFLLNKLEAKVLNDLKEFIPDGLFTKKIGRIWELHNGRNIISDNYKYERAFDLGVDLFTNPQDSILTARQLAASEVLIYLSAYKISYTGNNCRDLKDSIEKYLDYFDSDREAKPFIPLLQKESKQSTNIPSKNSGGGRPPSIEKDAKILGQIIEALTEGENLNPFKLPGSANDLLFACNKVSENKIGKKIFKNTKDAFKERVKKAGYGFGGGRTPSAEKNYWTNLCIKNIGKIDHNIFSEFNEKNTLYPTPINDSTTNKT